jgi:hypothetical protein
VTEASGGKRAGGEMSRGSYFKGKRAAAIAEGSRKTTVER